MDLHSLIVLICCLVTTVTGMVAGYLKFANEFNYIKGQLSLVLKDRDLISGLQHAHGKMEAEFAKTARDVDLIRVKVKHLESRITGGLL